MISVVLQKRDIQRLTFALKNTSRRLAIEVDILPKRGAVEFVNLLKERITTQNFGSETFDPLNERYATWKSNKNKKTGFWEMDGHLFNSLTVYKTMAGDWVGGVHPAVVDNNGVPVSYYAKRLEEGTEYIPARPLFGPAYRDFKYQIWPGMLKQSINNIKKQWR